MKRRFGWFILLFMTLSVAAQELTVEDPDVPVAPEAALSQEPLSTSIEPSPSVSPTPGVSPSPSVAATPAVRPSPTPVVSPKIHVERTDEIRYPDASAVLNPAKPTPTPQAKNETKPTPSPSAVATVRPVAKPSSTKPILWSKPEPVVKPATVPPGSTPRPSAIAPSIRETWYWGIVLPGSETQLRARMQELSATQPKWLFRLQRTDVEGQWKVLTGPSSEVTLLEVLRAWGSNAPVQLERVSD